MSVLSRSRRVLNRALDYGTYPGEHERQRTKRLIILIAMAIAVPGAIVTALVDLSNGLGWVAFGNFLAIGVMIAALLALRAMPRRFSLIVNVIFGATFLSQISETALVGGLFASGLEVVYGLVVVLGALVALSVRAAFWWFGAFMLSLVFAVVIPELVDPVYEVGAAPGNAAFNLSGVAAMTFAVMVYFVRQRDRFQQQSDDLLHNILPDEIADRLKASDGMIADSFDAASVMFADVVDFTPLSSTLTPQELVGLLNEVFSEFDGFVAELGLEKIKTVGDEYMVASGIPTQRSDHAHAIAELALRIRDHVSDHDVGGHSIRLRIGVNSGPVVAGIIGTRRFAYDLWGDVVNTASRMESEGVPDSIQVSEATYELIRDEFTCEPRGLIPVKGKGEMATYFLVGRRDGPA